MNDKKSRENPKSEDRNRLSCYQRQGESEDRAYSRTLAKPNVRAAITGKTHGDRLFGHESDVMSNAQELRELVRAVNGGDMTEVEATLVSQANTLDLMFNRYATIAANAQLLPQLEAYMRIALRAQNQCRATLETLAEIKTPRSVAFVKQANIANGPQQVNNGDALKPRAPERLNMTSELLENKNGEWLDIGATGQASKGNQTVEAVGAIDRAEKR